MLKFFRVRTIYENFPHVYNFHTYITTHWKIFHHRKFPVAVDSWRFFCELAFPCLSWFALISTTVTWPGKARRIYGFFPTTYKGKLFNQGNCLVGPTHNHVSESTTGLSQWNGWVKVNDRPACVFYHKNSMIHITYALTFRCVITSTICIASS